MKKLIIIAAMALTATGANAQTKKTTTTNEKFNYKVGIVTTLPFDISNGGSKVYAGSTLLELNRKISKKIALTANSGFFRINNSLDEINGRIPILLGAKYFVTEQWYFGASAGCSIITNPDYDGETNFNYSPYLGYQQKKISIDFRYYVSGLKKEKTFNAAMLVFSYQL